MNSSTKGHIQAAFGMRGRVMPSMSNPAMRASRSGMRLDTILTRPPW